MVSDQQSDAPAAEVEIRRGSVGAIGASRVGLSAVTATPPPFQGAMPGASANVVVAYEVAGVHVESTLTVHERMWLPLADGLHRVAKLGPSGGTATVDRDASRPLADAVYAGAEGKLRIGGPDVDDAVDVRVLEFTPDRHVPQSAKLEWLPAAYARSDTPKQQIKQQAVKVGDHLAVGKAMLSVKAIEGESAEHPAWVQFELTPAR